MTKPKTQRKVNTYPCKRCSEPVPNNHLRCSSCGAFNGQGLTGPFRDETILLSKVPDAEYPRIETGPWDIVWGGGITNGSTTLLGGEPGAGKSTLSIRLASLIAKATKKESLYVAAEERAVDIKARAKRTKVEIDGIRMFPIGTDMILVDAIEHHKPSIVILDSLPGLVGEDLDAACKLCKDLTELAHQTNVPIIIVDHVTKDLEFGGRMTLQHTVDTTMLFSVEEALEDIGDIRMLRAVKNRHGAIGQCFFEMTAEGLVWVDPKDLEDDEDDDDA